MQTSLSPEFKDSSAGREAESILRSCVHCGFCNATCPTYQILGDELDGPRGRIYLIKGLLEGGEVRRSTQQHLDRCLTCLNCETTCPSGVQYGKLVAIGRALVDERVTRPPAARLQRWLLREGLTSRLFAPLLALARHTRFVLPKALRKYVPPRSTAAIAAWPAGRHERKVLLLAGCVQPSLLPNINGATARVLDAGGIQTLIADRAGCCGALREHLGDPQGGLADARRNIDAWWPLVAAGTVESIVMNASACGLAVKQYGEALRRDPQYCDKAARISALARDLSELLPELLPALKRLLPAGAHGRLTFHPPCTLQHGQGLRGGVEAQLADLGFEVEVAKRDGHLCCGSAGTYSVLQPALARELRDRKLANLVASRPACIVSANVGCIQHLQSGTDIPVRHWVEVVDMALAQPGGAVPPAPARKGP
jgi:glycolate oxidase iron-sulfur subunit